MTNLDHAYAVILAGGKGERFWPLSTSRSPKQLLSLVSERTMLGMAVDRLEGLIPPERVIVLTSADLVEPTVASVPDLPAANIIGEPMGRDTAAAVALGCAIVKARDPEGVFCILTADHVIGDIEVFRRTLREGIDLAAGQDVLVTIGIQPTFPATGYGYIESGNAVEHAGETTFLQAKRFVEKPPRATAEQYLASGAFAWNSGMFIWSCTSVQAAFGKYRPQLSELIDTLAPSVDSPGFADALRAVFEPLEKISIDYALMENADNIVMARGTFAWDDVGSWPALANHFPADDEGNTSIGDVVPLDANNNLVFSNGRLTALIGVSDLVVVQAEGATLICPRDRAQDVKALVNELKARGSFDELL